MLKDQIVSIVIVRNRLENNQVGYTSMLRFTDKTLDRSFSADTKYKMYGLVEYYIRRGSDRI